MRRKMKVDEHERRQEKYKYKSEIDISKELLWRQIKVMIPFLLEVIGVYMVKIDKDIVSQRDHHPFIITFTY